MEINTLQRFIKTNFDTLYYGRHLSPDEVSTIFQSHVEGSSLRGVSRISSRAYGTVVSLIREASQKAQMIHNAEVKAVETTFIILLHPIPVRRSVGTFAPIPSISRQGFDYLSFSREIPQ